MTWDEWNAAYTALLDAYDRGRLDHEQAMEQCAALRRHTVGLPFDKLATAEFKLANLDTVLSPQARERSVRAMQAYHRAQSTRGTVAERRAVVERGIGEIQALIDEATVEFEKQELFGWLQSLQVIAADLDDAERKGD